MPARVTAEIPTLPEPRGHYGDLARRVRLLAPLLDEPSRSSSSSPPLADTLRAARDLFQAVHNGSKIYQVPGEGLGSERSGRAHPIMAGDVKKDHLGVGAIQPGEVSSEDDIYEQYKKRMMLGYRHKPNPLNNPRKAYY